jgi:hypothetical protein
MRSAATDAWSMLCGPSAFANPHVMADGDPGNFCNTPMPLRNRDSARRWPRPAGEPSTDTCARDDRAIAKGALKAFVRLLARAAAIEDYRRSHGDPEGKHEGGDLRSI